MKRKIFEWTISDIYKKRGQISFPDYQREPKLWSLKDKQLLIDSILNDIDIPKLYFHESQRNIYEVIDGQQRLWAIWGFIDNEYVYKSYSREIQAREIEEKKFQDFSNEYKNRILNYLLQITLIYDATDEYLRTLFLRLQLGLLLVAGEKLHASTGLMRDFVFKKMVKHPFVRMLAIPERRYARETLCAQICINSFSRKNINEFYRTRYEDLIYFFEGYKKPEGNDHKFFVDRCKHIFKVLDVLNVYFKERARELKNRSFILSIYLFVEKLIEQQENKIDILLPLFVRFSIEFVRRLRAEAQMGIKRRNEALYLFESYLSNAPGEKYQITRRHEKLKEFFDLYMEKKVIMGD